MRRSIHGKVYDTSTDEEIASWHNGHYGNDPKRCEETLYRTREGAWFLHGEGGSHSIYAPRVGSNDMTDGERIKPMNDVEVRAWCKKNGKRDVLEKYFPDNVSKA